ncbi:Hypothetical predicted protein [Marmota monax]|uniref:Uncharacterized protein n=1 Tax=Marmota monax TaxID=9995 RepID=A0A5E4AQE8_MARMO|nr:Hypothetical predicted protein [Marmota monax]
MPPQLGLPAWAGSARAPPPQARLRDVSAPSSQLSASSRLVTPRCGEKGRGRAVRHPLPAAGAPPERPSEPSTPALLLPVRSGPSVPPPADGAGIAVDNGCWTSAR